MDVEQSSDVDNNGNLSEVEEPAKDNLEGATCPIDENVTENERSENCDDSREIHPDVVVYSNEGEKESSGFGDQLNNNAWNADNPLSCPQPFIRPQLSLAEMWRYPSVHHTVVAYPIFTPHPHQLSKIRQQNEKLRNELQKEPEKHRLSEERERPSKRSHASTNTSIDNRRQTNAAHPIHTSNVKPSSFNPENQRHEVAPTSTSDPAGGVVRNSVRNSKGYSKQGSVLLGNRESQLTKVSNPNPILESIRVQNEDVEYHKTQAKFARWHRKCWKSFIDCVTSEKCNCCSFVLLIVVVLCLCIIAILFPILKVLIGS